MERRGSNLELKLNIGTKMQIHEIYKGSTLKSELKDVEARLLDERWTKATIH